MKRTILLLASLLCLCNLEAKVKFSSVIGSNMVLQQESDVKVWGTALPGRTVTISASWAGEPVSVAADAAGNWEAVLRTPSYGGPYTITANDGKKKKTAVTLDNILIGEVWLCSGQSNMEMCVRDSRDAEKEIAQASNYPEIRILRIGNRVSSYPLEEAEIW
ncbi:MAG: 9-O-acetylesterase, partial [Bacteroidales bacterium]|nr:9-O-acetylesterase [Bacteroidales bacterium]